MIRLNLVLLLAVVLSALYLVNEQYESRRLFAELHKAQAQGRRLEQEHERLEVDLRAQATSARVEQIARTQLQMRPATPAITTYITFSTPATPAQGVAVGALGDASALGQEQQP
jgi:cell division protein FtsL